MKKINNYWVDDNNNSWSCDIETEESASNKSKSLIDCCGCIDCRDCIDCIGCRGCLDCIGCRGCSNYKENPQRYTSSKIGSRNANTTAYWLGEDVQIICGCFRGDLAEFEAAVRETHAETEHLNPYLKLIENLKVIIAL